MIHDIATEINFWTDGPKGIKAFEEDYLFFIAEAVSSEEDKTYLGSGLREIEQAWGADEQSR